MEYKISINPLVAFSKGTELKKRRIIRDQKNPSVFKVGWYQTPRACIKKSISQNGNNDEIIKGLERLKDKVVEKPRQIQNKTASMEATRKYLKIEFPEILKNHNLNIIKKRFVKSTWVNGVEITVSPDVVFTFDYKGKKYIGGVKIHLSKGDIFDLNESKMVATILHKHISEIAANYDAIPLHEICLSIDVFGQRIVSSAADAESILNEVIKICNEIKQIWNVA